MARQIAGDNHPKIETIWLHQILREAEYCHPFTVTAGNSEEPTPSANQSPPSAFPVIRSGFQDVVHGRLPLPYGPCITSIRVQARAKDQGWCGDPSRGSWTWGELAWASQSHQLEAQVSEQRFEVYRNAIQINGWQDHDVVFEGDRLQALLDARPSTQSGPPQLVFMIRSRYSGWYHTVDRVQVTVEWDGVADSCTS